MTKLEKFLFNRGLLEAFKRNIREIGEYPFRVETFFENYGGYQTAIQFPFSWSRSREGIDVWGKCSDEWNTLFNKPNLI